MTDLLMHLEATAVETLREAFADESNVAVFISEGLGSKVLRRLIHKANFPFSHDYSLVHIDEGSDIANMAGFIDSVREEEPTNEIIVRTVNEMRSRDPHFANIPHKDLCNFVLKDIVTHYEFDTLITGVQWNAGHPWLSHEVVFRSSGVRRLEPLGNWTRRDIENYAAEKIQGFVKPTVRVS